jgi:hypothetical protein
MFLPRPGWCFRGYTAIVETERKQEEERGGEAI